MEFFVAEGEIVDGGIRQTLVELDYRFEFDLSFLHVLRAMPLTDMSYRNFSKIPNYLKNLQ